VTDEELGIRETLHITPNGLEYAFAPAPNENQLGNRNPSRFFTAGRDTDPSEFLTHELLKNSPIDLNPSLAITSTPRNSPLLPGHAISLCQNGGE
jgi:hypothetical protein